MNDLDDDPNEKLIGVVSNEAIFRHLKVTSQRLKLDAELPGIDPW